MGNISNVIVSLGNHDINKDKKLKYYNTVDILYNNFLDNMSKLNIKFLNNSVYEDKNVRFVGFNLPINCYNKENSLEFENIFYNSLDTDLFLGNDNKINIAIIHNPMNVCNDSILKKLCNFDIILSGHMHNGLVFNFIDKIFNGNRGIIDPEKKLFPKYARNSVDIGNNKHLVISGGITKLSKTSGIFRFGDILYPMEIDQVNIKKKIKK